MKPIYILDAKRTPQGSFLGQLADLSAPQLMAQVIQDLLAKNNINNQDVNEVFFGQVVTAGVGQAPARQAALFANLPNSVGATTINKVCGSGMQATIFGARSIALEENELILTGGMENMSQAPFLLEKGRTGNKFGHMESKDALLHDGLWDVYNQQPMGVCAEECVKKYQFTREEQDEFAKQSFQRAQKASKEGIFHSEITPITLKTRKGDITINEDEGPFKANFDKMAGLRPAFIKDGTITAANASTINDGASALLLGSEKYKNQAKFKITSWGHHAGDPVWFTTAPVEAIKKNLAKENLKVSDIDLWEINEAFATVTMAAIRELELNPETVNIYGGAISLGHPIGSSGSRVLVTLMNALERTNKKRGLASLCIGGGEALSMIIERL